MPIWIATPEDGVGVVEAVSREVAAAKLRASGDPHFAQVKESQLWLMPTDGAVTQCCVCRASWSSPNLWAARE